MKKWNKSGTKVTHKLTNFNGIVQVGQEVNLRLFDIVPCCEVNFYNTNTNEFNHITCIEAELIVLR